MTSSNVLFNSIGPMHIWVNLFNQGMTWLHLTLRKYLITFRQQNSGRSLRNMIFVYIQVIKTKIYRRRFRFNTRKTAKNAMWNPKGHQIEMQHKMNVARVAHYQQKENRVFVDCTTSLGITIVPELLPLHSPPEPNFLCLLNPVKRLLPMP